jgi:uncharacterized Zn-binding protein involved in type VI secretion
MRAALLIIALFAAAPAPAQALPACAKTGAKTVFFNGKPALKISDAAACPAGSFEIIPNIIIEGEPAVHFTTGIGNCVSGASPNVIMNGKAATAAGDIACQ